ncbi:MAG: hypothetical protein ACYCW6_20835 [Candidatus Xenobia bacterium]
MTTTGIAGPTRGSVNHYVEDNHLDSKYLLPGGDAQPAAGADAQAAAGGDVHTGLEVTAGIPMAGAAINTVTALQAAHAATALAGQAQSLGAAAQAAAMTGHLTQAGALAAQARATGAQAMALGNRAQAAAGLAKGFSIAGGAVAVVDGGVDIYQGVSATNTITELHHVATNRLDDLSRAGRITPSVQSDYGNVNTELNHMQDHATRQTVGGGAKVVFGGMMIASPFTGPAAPIVGGIGALGYIITSIVE